MGEREATWWVPKHPRLHPQPFLLQKVGRDQTPQRPQKVGRDSPPLSVDAKGTAGLGTSQTLPGPPSLARSEETSSPSPWSSVLRTLRGS